MGLVCSSIARGGLSQTCVDERPAVDIFNLMQDVRSLYLIVDIRSSSDNGEGRVDGAVRLESKNPKDLVTSRFQDINVQSSNPIPFSLCVCQGSSIGAQTSGRILSAFAATRKKFKPFYVSNTLSFQYDEFQSRFPFACSNFVGGFEEDRVFPSCIVDRLFLGHWAVASDVHVVRTCLQATHVVNCTRDHPSCFEADGVSYFRVPVRDDQTEDILAYLDGATVFIDNALSSGGVVLVHCKHGQSRSASVVVAWLMRFRRMNLEDSLAHLKRCRPRVGPNCGFIKQLQKFGESV
eukprot:TRINITY_DN27157_c0_g1_i1.p1 TRINITY_DN27157_c0_g1~~TRINITY_DN27157_c0_g1_i1.p1  ORF type:complete len:293 (+),score=16.11 TRINITY_DN27157_c0_g1_i1:119-997(+)